jgi:UDP-N-acetylglucosamine 2-epimerase (non-hydrolysing)
MIKKKYLICFGTRPELIKLIPLIKKFREGEYNFLTLFTGQHETLIDEFYDYIGKPDIIFTNIMEHGQSLNKLTAKILDRMDSVYDIYKITNVVIQGDTTSGFAIALSAYNKKIKVIHLEAGLRTADKYSPYPEEVNRRCISEIADIHFCPTISALNNLTRENITHDVYLVGNTIVDTYKLILQYNKPEYNILQIVEANPCYIVVTMHRRENRGVNMTRMWNELNILSSTYKFVYIYHPSVPESKHKLCSNIHILEPQNYANMVYLINNSSGIISDSGGIAEEAVCSNKKILICRDTTERMETIQCGLGRLIYNDIIDNITFLHINDIIVTENPYGTNVCDKMMQYLQIE